jgi:hypothetical protein
MVVLFIGLFSWLKCTISNGNLIIAWSRYYSSVSNLAINTAYQGTNITKWTSSFNATIPTITGTSIRVFVQVKWHKTGVLDFALIP